MNRGGERECVRNAALHVMMTIVPVSHGEREMVIAKLPGSLNWTLKLPGSAGSRNSKMRWSSAKLGLGP